MAPSHFKEAQLTPIIKKHNLDLNTLNHYQPISNLPYLSKLVETAVVQQLSDYMAQNSLLEPLQSAYHKSHSTETAIIYVLNNLLTALNSNNIVFVTLLDCSAAFDLVDHQILLQCLSSLLGITGVAHDWFNRVRH